IKSSTGFSPFMLRLGLFVPLHLSPQVVPPLIELTPADIPTLASDIIKLLNDVTAEAKDNLLAAKISQTIQANAHCRQDQLFSQGDLVYLSTSNRHTEYMHTGDNRVAK
ncbi:hypothetical protein PLEOSDRAFT_1026518, partial [Pleurotus ostreatus PC15]